MSASNGAPPESPLSALERSLGVTSVQDNEFDGAIESDDGQTPPGRQQVVYSHDPLFSPENNNNSNVATHEVADSHGGGIDGLTGSLMQLLGDPTAAIGAGGGGALVAQLEAMAAQMEEASGEDESDIRSRIAMLRSVLEARPAQIAQGRERLGAAMRALDADEQRHASNPAALAAGEAAAASSVCAGSLQSIESDLGSVDSMLRESPEAAVMLGSLLQTPPPPGAGASSK